MTDFSTWQRATLEQFAREARDKLIENREAIAELVEALKDLTDSAEENLVTFRSIDEARAAIIKHTPNKEQ